MSRFTTIGELLRIHRLDLILGQERAAFVSAIKETNPVEETTRDANFEDVRRDA